MVRFRAIDTKNSHFFTKSGGCKKSKGVVKSFQGEGIFGERRGRSLVFYGIQSIIIPNSIVLCGSFRHNMDMCRVMGVSSVFKVDSSRLNSWGGGVPIDAREYKYTTLITWRGNKNERDRRHHERETGVRRGWGRAVMLEAARLGAPRAGAPFEVNTRGLHVLI